MSIDWSLQLSSPRINLAQVLVHRHVAEGRGGRPAVHHAGGTCSYDTLWRRVADAAVGLRLRGVRRGDKVLLVMPDSLAFPVALYAVLAVGAVAVLANPLLPADDLRYMAGHVDARFAVVRRQLGDKLNALAADGIDLVYCGDGTEDADDFERLGRGLGDGFVAVDTAADELAYVLYSSGTTGRPKAIPRRHRDILHCAHAFGHEVMAMDEHDVVIAVPKLTFGYGLGGSLLFAGVVGASCVVFEGRSLAPEVAAQLRRHRPSLFLGTPRIIAELLKTGAVDALRPLRMAASAGEALPPSVLRDWRAQVGVPLVDGFGSTEVGHIFISNLPDQIEEGVTGRCLSAFRVKLIDDLGAELGDGQAGRMCIAGPSVADGYLNDPERTAAGFVDGWHVSNDVFIRQGGAYTYVGRADDMVKRGCGEWISPYEVEDELLKLPSVLECAVVGTQAPSGVIGLKAFVVLTPSTAVSQALGDELIGFTRERWPDFPHKHLDSVEFLSELPRNASGKIQRAQLRQQSLTEFSYDC